MRRRSVLAGPLACLLAITLAGCPASPDSRSGDVAVGSGDSPAATADARRIIILTNGDDPFWDACEAGAMAAAKDFDTAGKGLSVVFERGNFSVERQVEMLRGYRLAGDVAGVGVSVVDGESKAIADELAALQDAGIDVVTIDGDVDRDLYGGVRKAYLGTENKTAGRELGKAAAALQPGGGRAATFVGIKSAANAVARVSGFVEGSAPAIKHTETMADGSDPAKARDYVRNALQRDPELDTLVGIWAYNAPAIVDVVDDLGVGDRTYVYSVDAAELTIRAMEAGKVDAMVVQNPFNMGRLGVQLLLALATGDESAVAEMYPNLGQPGGDVKSTGLKVVVPEGSPLTAETFDPKTEFLRLPEFLAWLDKYGLKSS